jgi:prophage DNA circulation protein
MNSWKDNLQPCSFRGIKFLVSSHSANFGRRIVSHEFPFGDKPSNKDLGKKSRSFNIEGFIVGNDFFKESDPRYICSADYFLQRDKIIEACETVDSGVLVHPYLGRMQVNCQSLSVSESLNDGGIVKLTFQFIESGDDLPPVVETDKISSVTKPTSKIKDESLINFKKIYAIINTAKSGIQKVKNNINSVMDEISEAQKLCADAAQIGHDAAQMVKELNKVIEKTIAFPETVCALFESSYAALSSSIDGFLSKNNALKVTTAAALIPEVVGAMASPNLALSKQIMNRSYASDAKRINAWARLASVKIIQPEILNTTANEAMIEKNNKDIIELTKRTMGLAYLADCVVTSQFATARDLNRAKELVLHISEDILEHPMVSDGMFTAILQMQIAICDAIDAIKNKLPIIHTYKVTKFW